jgi:(p)ppGpp synthase/HD superfamily hydrolase
MIEKAIKIAIDAHGNQTDRNGMPYLIHVFNVMSKGKTIDEKICGILHDVVEKSKWTFDDLLKEGFSEEIVEAVRCLSKKDSDEPYDSYIERVTTNQLAISVKLNDLEDNMDIRRMVEITEKELPRLNKFIRAYNKLSKLKDA